MLQQPPRLDAMQGASEKRTELYLTYSEEVPQQATQQCAKSDSSATGFARRQADAARRL